MLSPRPTPKSSFLLWIARYGAALGLAVLALSVRLAFAPLLGTTMPVITFFPAIMVSAWYGGLGPAIVTTGVGGLCFLYFLPGEGASITTAQIVGMALYCCVGLLCGALTLSLRSSRRQADVSRDQAEESERRFRLLFENSTDPMAVALGETHAYVNASYAMLFGYDSADELSGVPIYDLIAPEEREAMRDRRARCMRGEVLPLHYLMRGLRRDQQEFDAEARVSSFTMDGKFFSLLIMRDVTAERQAERRLRESEEALRDTSEKLKAIIQSSPLPIVALSAAGDIQVWNPAAEKVFGWSSREVLGKQIPFIPEEKRSEHQKMRSHDLEGKGFVNNEVERHKKDGSPIDVSVSTAPLRDFSGQGAGIMSIYVDVTERKRMEQELRESEARFRALLEQSPFSTKVISLDGRIVRANAAWEQMWGLRVEDVAGFNLFEESGAYCGAFREYLLRARDGEAISIPETLVIPAHGSRRNEAVWVRASVYPVRGKDGAIREVVLVEEDITELRRIQDGLRASEERLRLAQEASGFSVWDVDLVTRRVTWKQTSNHPTKCGDLGEDPTIDDCIAILHPEDREGVLAALEEAVAGRWMFNREFRLMRDGRVVQWVLARGIVHWDQNGRPLRMVGASFDLTERKQAEERVKYSENYWRELADLAPALLWMTDADARRTYISQRLCQFVGIRNGDALLAGDGVFAHPDDKEMLDRTLLSANSRQEPFSIDCRVRRHDGQWRWVIVSAEPRFGVDGEYLGYIGNLHDITERKLAEEELRRSNEELLKANRELEEFAYAASHDLQEPLRMVNIFTQLLIKRFVPGDRRAAREYAAYIADGVERMSRLLDDLLSYSRTIHQENDAHQTADLSAALAGALAVLQMSIFAAKATVTYDDLPVVTGDEGQFGQIFQNLLSNALKYSRRDVAPRIHVSARRDGGTWVISVSDNGIGFDPQYAERIFGLFKRLHKDAYPGTGLGLAICKRIVERHRGRIWAESEPEHGATFYFALPVMEELSVASESHASYKAS